MAETTAPARESFIARVHRQIFDRPAGAIGVALATFVVTAWFALRLRYLHDEGLFTLDQARLASPAFWPMFFFIKAKPLLLLLYWLPAKVGIYAYLLTHAAVAALGVHFISRAAARLEIAHPNIAGLTLATSTTMAIAASNGVPNSDGAAALSLCLYLHFSGRRRWAAAALGALPFVRHELAPVTLVLLAWDLRERRDFAVLGAVVAFPVAYWLAGTVYHGTPLWLYTLFPNSQGVPEAIKTYQPPSLAAVVTSLRGAVAMNSPILVATALFGASRRNRASLALLLMVVLVYGIMTAFQMGGFFGFDTSPRYYLAPLPLLALLAASALSPPQRLRWIPGLLVALIAVPAPLTVVVAATGFVAGACALARSREGANLAFLAGSIAAFVHLAQVPGREMEQHAQNHRLIAALKASGVFHGQPLFTTSYLARDDRCASVPEAYLLVNQAMAYERRSLHVRSDQLADLAHAADLAHIVILDNHVIRRDAVYAIADHPRNDDWRAVLEASHPRRTQVHDGRQSYLVYSWPEGGAQATEPVL